MKIKRQDTSIPVFSYVMDIFLFSHPLQLLITQHSLVRFFLHPVNEIGAAFVLPALKEQVKAMGSDPSEFLGANPFTASFELRMNALYANSDSLAWITAKLKKNPLVEDVMYQKELVDTVNDNLRRISYVLLGLAVLLALVSFALINNTVRLSIYSGRFVIRTMKLVGASWGFIRRPFMARSFNLGFLSGLLADAVLWGGVHTLLQYDPSLSQYIHVDMLLVVGAAVLLFGLLLTLGCTYVSVNKYLRMKVGDLY